jgi:hypothetical protein
MGVLLEAGRAENPVDPPLASAESARQEPPRSFLRRSFTSDRHPRGSAAEGALAPTVDPVGGEIDRAEELDVRTQDRPREIVLGGRPVTGPVDEEARPRGRRKVLLPFPRVFGEGRRALFRGIPQDPGKVARDPLGIFVQVSGQRLFLMRVGHFGDGLRLEPVEAGREAERLRGGNALASERLRPRGAALEFQGRPRGGGARRGRVSCRPRPSGTSRDGGASPTWALPCPASSTGTCRARPMSRGRCARRARP